MLVWCLWSCVRPWSVCEVVFVPYVDAVVAVTVMHVLLFVLHVCMLGGGVCLCVFDSGFFVQRIPYVHLVLNPVAPYRYLLPIVSLSVAYIANPDLLACGCRTLISVDIVRYLGAVPGIQRVPMTGLPKNGNHGVSRLTFLVFVYYSLICHGIGSRSIM